jgi:gluconolactonase
MSQIREIASRLFFPEAPVVLPDGSLLVASVAGRRVLKVDAKGALTTVAEIDGAPNGLALGPDGRCYVANNGGLNFTLNADGTATIGAVSIAPDYKGGSVDRIDLASGRVERLYTNTDKSPLSGPNDLVFDKTGGFWLTDTGKGREREYVRGKLVYATPDGKTCREAAFPMWMPNGCGLSPDEKTVYVAETATARIWAFELEAPGVIKRSDFPSPHGGRMLFQAPMYCMFDSLAVDSAGNVCVATIVDSSILVISPDGKLVERVPVPDTGPTNICFGGKDLRTAYVTLGNTSKLVSMEWPRPGLKLNFQPG